MNDGIRPSSALRFHSPVHLTGDSPKKSILIARIILGDFADEFIRYYKLGVKILNTILKVVVLNYSELAEKVGRVVASIALFTLSLKFIVQLKSIYMDSKRFERNYRLSDREGIVASFAAMVIKPFEIIDGILSLGKSLNTLYGLTWIQLFTLATTPIAVALLCYATISRIYKALMIGLEFSELPHINSDRKKFTPENSVEVINYLQKKVGITPQEREKIEIDTIQRYKIVLREKGSDQSSIQKNSKREKVEKQTDELFKTSNLNPKLDQLETLANDHFRREIKLLKQRKINRLKRRIDKKTVKYMKTAHQFFNNSDNSQAALKKTFKTYHDIKKLVIRRTVFNVGKMLFSVAKVIAYIASLFFITLNPVIPFLLTLSSTAFSIFKHVFTYQRMNHGLKNPEFYGAVV